MIAALLLAQALAGPLAAPLGDFGDDPDMRKHQGLPLEVRVFIDRRMGCNHWAGEEPYDPARAKEIAAAMGDLKCEALEAEEPKLRRRYAAQPPVLKALDATRDAYW